MGGFQLWANLPASQKMMDPRYRDVKSSEVPSVQAGDAHIVDGFHPVAVRVRDSRGRVTDSLRSTEANTIEFEYSLQQPIQGLRVGIYLQTVRGETLFTSFDTDDGEMYERFGARPAGHYRSTATLPPDLLNEGRYLIGVNASVFRMKRYFHDERALTFSVDPSGAPGMQWAEARQGAIRPRLQWQIEQVE